MFGKLLKNDLKVQFHSVYVLLFILAVIAVVAELAAFFIKDGQNAQLVRVLGSLLAMMVLLVGCFIVIGAIGANFSKTLFGRSGYLSLTLPVKTSLLVRSKTLSGLLWVWLVFVAFIGSMLFAVWRIENLIDEKTISAAESLLETFELPSFDMLAVMVGYLCLTLLATAFLLVQTLYFGVTLGHVSPFSKLGKFGEIVYFLVIFGILTSIADSIEARIPVGFVVTADRFTLTTNVFASTAGQTVYLHHGILGLVSEVLFAVGLHYPITYLLKKKVNVA